MIKIYIFTTFHEGYIKIRRKPLNMLRARKNSPGYLSPSLIHTVVPIQTWSYAYRTILYQWALDLYSFNNKPYVCGVRHENSKSGLAVMVLSTVSVLLAQRRCHNYGPCYSVFGNGDISDRNIFENTKLCTLYKYEVPSILGWSIGINRQWKITLYLVFVFYFWA